MHNVAWRGLYRGERDLATPESNAHPAKMSWGLCERILAHLRELGLLREGDSVLDFMAGTGRTSLVAGAMGYRSVTLELEEKFVGFQHQNKQYAERKLGHPLDWTILQGDARNLASLLAERGLRGIVSPPYDGDVGHGGTPTERDVRKRIGGDHGVYGSSSGQLGAESGESYLSAMAQVYAQAAQVCSVLVVVTKNPTRNGKLRLLHKDTYRLLKQAGFRVVDYHRAILFEEGKHADLFGGEHRRVRGRMSFFKRLSYQRGLPVARWEDVFICVRDGVGLVGCTSPPYADAQAHPSIGNESTERDWGHNGQSITKRRGLDASYGATPGQIGALRD